jgi:toxin HigB-1
VIASFANKTTQDIYDGVDSKAARHFPQAIWPVAARKLDILNSAYDLRDLRIPPSNRLEVLKGKWSGYYSIRINEQYRIVFKWIDNNAHDVMIIDYY